VIEIPRTLARQFRGLLRKSVLAADPRGPCPLVLIRAGKNGLTLSCQQGDVGLRFHLSGRLPAASVALPATALADLEGPADEVVSLEQSGPMVVQATWPDGGMTRRYDTADPATQPAFPELPGDALEMPAEFLSALGEATRTTSRKVVRYALSCILLSGKSGEVIGTDGRQLLLQGGFPLPWGEDLLIPSLPAFTLRELASLTPIRLGKVAERVLLGVGPWLFALRVEANQRYPDVTSVIPRVGSSSTLLHVDPEDAEVLIKTLPHLPGAKEVNAPVTLDIGKVITVRADAEKESSAEVVLTRSRAEGPPTSVVMDRHFLLRAVQLGFHTITVVKPDCPLLCRDERRTYLWMPLGPGEPSATEPARCKQITANTTSAIQPEPEIERSPAMPSNNGSSTETPRDGPGSDDTTDLLAEAEELRALLQDGVVRAGRLIAALRHQRKQTRALHSALTSLRRLQQLDS
jgi:hypothetical protein